MTVAATTPSVVETRGLTKRYGPFLALDNLDLTIGPGVVFGFIGPNGAGKTTTMRILATLLDPSGGDAWVAGHSVTRDQKSVRHVIGYMPDQFGVYDNMKVWEYLDFFAATYGIARDRRLGLIDDLLALVDLSEKKDGYVEALSRGMKQRLCLARTLVHDPQLLILDEPASGLDPRARVELRALLRQLGALGKTVIVSSHILTEMADICDEVGIIERGRLLASGPIDDLLRRVRNNRVLTIRLLPDGGAGDDEIVERVRTIPGVLAAAVEQVTAAGRGAPAVVAEAQARAVQAPANVPTAPAPVVVDGVTATNGPAAPSPVGVVSTDELLAAVPPASRIMRVEFDGDDHSLYQFLAELLRRGLPVYGFTEEIGDLEDAFMRITKGMVA
ncbi:MAG: ATP-binding cassette domain-containing protein [Chloroflexota bacterium]|nr:ATP-binding cassette domain-containing protein [Chloroflexota bacterium]